MPFVPKDTKNKVQAVYKTIYLPKDICDELLKIADDNGTSFNNVVVSMIEECLKKK